MKKLTLSILSIAALSVASTQAQVIETFNYATGALGGTASTGTGTDGNWGTYPASWLGYLPAGSATSVVASGSLTAPTGYGFTPTNNKLSSSGDTDGMFGLATGNRIDFDTDGTYYASYLFGASADPIATSGRGHVEFRNSSNAVIFSVGDSDTGSQGKLQVSAGGTAVAGSDWAGSGDYLILVKIETVATGNDSISASYFKSTGSVGAEPTSWDVTNSTALTGTATSVLFSSRGPDTDPNPITYEFDEFRMTDSYATVIPEPSSVALLGLGLMGLMARRRRR